MMCVLTLISVFLESGKPDCPLSSSGLQFTGSQRVRHNWSNLAHAHTHTHTCIILRCKTFLLLNYKNMKCEINNFAEIPFRFKVLTSTTRQRMEKWGAWCICDADKGAWSPLHPQIPLDDSSSGENQAPFVQKPRERKRTLTTLLDTASSSVSGQQYKLDDYQNCEWCLRWFQID